MKELSKIKAVPRVRNRKDFYSNLHCQRTVNQLVAVPITCFKHLDMSAPNVYLNLFMWRVQSKLLYVNDASEHMNVRMYFLCIKNYIVLCYYIISYALYERHVYSSDTPEVICLNTVCLPIIRYYTIVYYT